jgi:hypothetical protein
MGAAPAAAQALGQLGEGPILVQVQPAGLALVIGEQRAVDIEEALEVGGAGEGVGRGRRVKDCQGQSLDSVADRPAPDCRATRSSQNLQITAVRTDASI